MAKLSKKKVAEFFGITTATLTNYENRAESGCEHTKRKLEALYYYYDKINATRFSLRKKCIDESGQTFYISYE